MPPPRGIVTGPARSIPLVTAESEVGILLAWSSPAHGFSDLDLALLDELASQLAPLLASWKVQSERLMEIERLVALYRQQAENLQAQVHALANEAQESTGLTEVEVEAREWIEDALRNLHNVAHLGQHPLARLRTIQKRLPSGKGAPVTHLERGQAVWEFCEELVERLRPPRANPTHPNGASTLCCMPPMSRESPTGKS